MPFGVTQNMIASYGAAISEPFVVTDEGGERLCDVRRELIVID